MKTQPAGEWLKKELFSYLDRVNSLEYSENDQIIVNVKQLQVGDSKKMNL